jgi:hypothetical protein
MLKNHALRWSKRDGETSSLSLNFEEVREYAPFHRKCFGCVQEWRCRVLPLQATEEGAAAQVLNHFP